MNTQQNTRSKLDLVMFQGHSCMAVRRCLKPVCVCVCVCCVCVHACVRVCVCVSKREICPL